MDAHNTYEKIGIASKAIIYISGLSIGVAMLIGGIMLCMSSFFSI